MIPMTLSRDLVAHLAAKRGATVVGPDDAPARVARALLSAVGRGVPALSCSAVRGVCAVADGRAYCAPMTDGSVR